jgi:hypothetical protein
MKLTFRLHTKDDESALIRLWSEHGGWDRVDAEVWGHRLLRTPLGESTIVVATDSGSGDIVGQFAFIPSQLCVNGRAVRAARPFTPIINKALRGSIVSLVANPLRHPIVAMYTRGIEALRESGHAVLYMVPDPNWLPFLRLFPSLQCGTFPLWSRPLPLAEPLLLAPDYTAAPLTGWDKRVDALWEKASRLHGCLVVRTSMGLPWKVSHGDYTVLAVERRGDLVGLVVSLAKGERQWLICDLLAADAEESLVATLAAVTNLADAKASAAPPQAPLQKVAVLVTPVLEPALRKLGFARDKYDFPLAVQVLDSAVAKTDVAPARWYVSAND